MDLDFSKLSKNIIIYEILPFLSVQFKSLESKKYDLFGYFKNDKTRKAFFLFRGISVRVNFENYNTLEGVFNFKQIQSLSIDDMYTSKEENKYDDNFVKKFVNLKKLVVSSNQSVFGENLINFKHLKRLEIFVCLDFKDIFFVEMELENLEMLRIYESCFTGVGWKPKKKLKKLYLQYVSFHDDLFVKQDLNNLHSLHLFSNNVITGKRWKKINNLRKLYLSYCKELDEENLIENINFSGIKKIFISKECDKITDNLFRSVSLPSLLRLEVYRNENLTGEGWNQMKSLEEIQILDSPQFNLIEFFKNQNLKNIKKVYVNGGLSEETSKTIEKETKLKRNPSFKVISRVYFN